jgi:peptidyl-prolyl cis-trans isomerase SurA
VCWGRQEPYSKSPLAARVHRGEQEDRCVAIPRGCAILPGSIFGEFIPDQPIGSVQEIPMRKLHMAVGAAAAAILLATAAAQAAGKVAYADSIAAVVGDEVITVFQLHEETRDVENRLREGLSGEALEKQVLLLRRSAAIQLVERELIFAEFETMGAQVPPKLLQERVDRVIVTRCGGDRKRFEETLHEQGMSMEEFRQEIRKKLSVDLYLQEYVFSRVQVGPAAVDAYFAAHQDEFGTPARIRLQVILLKGTGAYAGKIDETAGAILDRCRGGESFVALAEECSEGPNVEEGGDLGWLETKRANPQLVSAVQGLEAGSIAPTAVSIGSNTYIVRLVEREVGGDGTLTEEVRQQIDEALKKQEQQRRYQELTLKLRKKYFVKTFF